MLDLWPFALQAAEDRSRIMPSEQPGHSLLHAFDRLRVSQEVLQIEYEKEMRLEWTDVMKDLIFIEHILPWSWLPS